MSLPAIDILKEEGYIYDSSIFSGTTFRSGIKSFKNTVHKLPNGLIEFPITSFTLMNFDVGAGGAYTRILPYNYFKRRLKKVLHERDALFYFHPWELDPRQPYIKGLDSRAVHTHYFNLHKTKKKIERLLNDFEFCPLKEIIAESEGEHG